ncbi:hypothetical protein EVAR_95902_1 [Eumeta japonica]|uniref:Uncharacterized protein n=1 Tax=Eumeta variegata TaxID=151549 RepID=A0A4C1XKY9_EUMVA|nr:hypothetical protein EVAR_95902_1 [Eumeta japonica]
MAKEAVNCLFYGETNPEEVMRTLEARFGRPTHSWYDYIATQKEDSAELPHMAEFLNREAERCGRYAAPEDLHARLSGTSETKTRRIQRAHATHHREIASTAYKARSCLICNGDHPMSACATFKEATIEERWEYCKKRNACFRCLMKDNFAIAVPRSPAASIAAEGHTIECCTTASDRPRVGAAHRHKNRAAKRS